MSEQTAQTNPIVLNAEKCVRQATVGGFIFTGIYVLAGIYLLSGSDPFGAVAVFCFIDAGLFFLGSLTARGDNRPLARVLWLIGGFLGLPLGLVMVGLANRMHAATKAAEQARDEQAAAALQRVQVEPPQRRAA
jgi:drug/metabolite transporter (DMT)-like permease